MLPETSRSLAALQSQYTSFKQRIETGPLYGALVGRAWPTSRLSAHCSIWCSPRRATTFQGATLTAQIDPRDRVLRGASGLLSFYRTRGRERYCRRKRDTPSETRDVASHGRRSDAEESSDLGWSYEKRSTAVMFQLSGPRPGQGRQNLGNHPSECLLNMRITSAPQAYRSKHLTVLAPSIPPRQFIFASQRFWRHAGALVLNSGVPGRSRHRYSAAAMRCR